MGDAAEDRMTRGIMTTEEVLQYVNVKNIVPGTILWSTDVDLKEDSIRSGGKNSPGADYLRWIDIGIDTKEGRITDEDLDKFSVNPGKGISMFIKNLIPNSMVWIGPGPMTNGQKKAFKKSYDPVREQFWWKVDHGQTIPAGLQIVYDGDPPGHCTLTVERTMTVRGFLELVSLIKFSKAGSDIFGQKL